MINFWRQGARSQTVYSIQSRKKTPDSFFFFLIIYLFIFGYAGSSLLQGVFSSFSNGDYSLVAVGGLLIAVTSPAAEVGSRAHRLQQLRFLDSRAQVL